MDRHDVDSRVAAGSPSRAAGVTRKPDFGLHGENRARQQPSEEGLRFRRLTGSRGYLRWSDLRRVNYTQAMKWFRLETRAGEVARVSAMPVGLREFARFLLRHAPPGAIDPETLPILKSTASCGSPPVWG